MDLTSLMSSLLSDQNIKAVASKAGVSEEEAASVLATALPVMLNGANGQASDAATTESFYKAVTDHAQKDPEKVDLKEGGKIVGHLLGFSDMSCIFLGGMLAMSSTTIIYKAFEDLGLRQQNFAGLVMSVLILEDILAIVMMVMLAAIADGGQAGGGQGRAPAAHGGKYG